MEFDFTELQAIFEQIIDVIKGFIEAIAEMLSGISYGFAGYPEETTAAPETTTEERQRPL